ncbi:MAG: hypothetical protein V3581_04270 [Candidatus Cardinium sp.]|uniref:hypothetical protein n=1 Tax=Candidatus Cardinium sp. TP TaxID=2961955 RepID=UPI0021AFDB0D|nr:hypothetical protein [Candidatus Cardinium sp. TP]MCT4697427.1 hypothetical protein [Candidatus Cardinium sp. TP]MDN5247316.1 hypothetical protein [Candidatus Cardinium sp.]
MSITYLPFTSSSCVRSELIPILNKTLSNLPEAIKEKYVHLMQTSNVQGDEKKQLKQHIDTIKDQNLVKKLINQYHTLYIILHPILPKDPYFALKNRIAQVTNLNEADEVDQYIASQLPKPFKELNEYDKEDIYNLSDDRRKNILTLMTAAPSPSYQETIDQPAHKDTIAHSEAIHKLIQEGKAQQAQDEDIPQDDWGDKLPLKGKDRMVFFNLMVEYNDNDQKALKKLFDEVDPDSVRNLAILFAVRFTKEENRRLISTMIYLYKGWPADTIKMCNNTANMSWVEKWKIFRRTTGSQLDTLQQLDKCLQELIEDSGLFKTKYAKQPNSYIGSLIDEVKEENITGIKMR